MKIDSVSVNHHKVLGSTKINLFKDSEELEEDILRKYHTDIHLEVSNSNEDNNYTYIIGQNGVGKTLLFRSIIHFINWNTKLDDEKLSDIISLYKNSGKYIKYNTEDLGYNELTNLGIYNKYFYRTNIKNYDFLNFYDSQLISISSTFGKNIIHKNPRFRSFNNISDINKIETLFLKSLVKFNNKQELTILENLLEKKTINWNLKCELSVSAVGGINDDTLTVLLKNSNGINIINFLKAIKKIKITREGELITENLDEIEIKVFEAIYNSSGFFKLYCESNFSFEKLFEKIVSGTVLKRIEHFLSQRMDSEGVEQSLNVRIKKDQKAEWESLFSNPAELSEFDVLVIGLLENLNLLDLNILCNDIPLSMMSSGEQSIIKIFSFFSDLPLKKSLKNLIVFYDEPENSLHPSWQQNFPIYFKKIVEEVYKIKSSHFLFATHSPLVLMKAQTVPNSNVLQFSKDKNGNFKSQIIDNINSFSIEEVLLDEFKISYRDKEVQRKVEEILNNKSKEIKENSDPIFSIEKSFELKKKIDDLYNKI